MFTQVVPSNIFCSDFFPQFLSNRFVLLSKSWFTSSARTLDWQCYDRASERAREWTNKESNESLLRVNDRTNEQTIARTKETGGSKWADDRSFLSSRSFSYESVSIRLGIDTLRIAPNRFGSLRIASAARRNVLNHFRLLRNALDHLMLICFLPFLLFLQLFARLFFRSLFH